MVVLPAGAQIPPYKQIKKGNKCRPQLPIITVEQSLKEEISRLSLTFESAFSYPIIILSCLSSLPPHLKQRPTPREIGAIVYIMDTGLMDSFHQFIEPGTLPIGFTYEAQFHSTETHKIPVTQFRYGSDNYTAIYKRLSDFVSNNSINNTVFTLKSEQKHVQLSVDWIRKNSRHPWLSRIRVLVLEDLITELITLSGYKVPVYITNYLIPQHFKYLSNLCCPWHSRQDMIECAQGSSVRMGYAMAALLYKYYPIVWGTKHEPDEPLSTPARDKDESAVSRYMRVQSAVPRMTSTSTPHTSSHNTTRPQNTTSDISLNLNTTLHNTTRDISPCTSMQNNTSFHTSSMQNNTYFLTSSMQNNASFLTSSHNTSPPCTSTPDNHSTPRNSTTCQYLEESMLSLPTLSSTLFSTLETQPSTLETQSSTLQTQSTSLETNSSTLQTQSTSLETNSSTLQTQSTSLETNSSTLQTQSTSLETNSSTLETQSSTLQTQSSTLETNSSTLETQSTSLETNSSTLQTQSTSLPTSGILSQSECNELPQYSVITNSNSGTMLTSVDESSLTKTITSTQCIKSASSKAKELSGATSVKTNPIPEPTMRPRIGRGYISSYVNDVITKPGHFVIPRRPIPRVRNQDLAG